MSELQVNHVMIPLAEYATVSEDATLFQAVQALSKSQEHFDQNKDRHRAILVLDEKSHVVGKLSQWDVIKGLEPNYEKIGDFRGTTHTGITSDFFRSMMKDYGLWNRPLRDLCRKASQIRVKDIMYTPTEGEYVKEEESLDQAIHQLIVGHHQSLLVVRGEKIVGILRLSDVFREVCMMILACEV